MTYLISTIVLILIATLMLGLVIGWLIWGRLKTRLQSVETDWRNRYLSLDSEYQSLIEDFKEVELTLKDRIAHISKLDNERNELARDLIAVTNLNNETLKETEELKNQLGQITARCHITCKELDTRKQELELLHRAPNEITELKTLLGQATQRYNNNGLELKNKNEELAALQNQFNETNKHRISLNKELEHLRAHLLKRDNEFENQVISFANLQNELSDSNEMLKIVQTELDSRDNNAVDNTQLKERDEKILVLENQISLVNKQYEDSQAELLDAKKHIPALNNEINSLRERIPSLERSLKQRDSSIAALEGEVSRLAKQFPPLQDGLDARTSHAEELKQKIHTLEQKIPAFKSTIAARDAHIRELEVFMKDAQKAILKPSRQTTIKNGNDNSNGNGHSKGKTANGKSALNGNVIQINGAAKTNGNGAVNNKTNGNGASKASGATTTNGKAKRNGAAKLATLNGKTATKTPKNSIKPYGLKKPIRKPDDLKLISGIGESLEKTLHKCGIFYFEQIASFNLKDVKTVDKLLNFRGRIDRDDWIKQARVLMRQNNNKDKNTNVTNKKASQKRTPQRNNRKSKMKPLGMKRPAGELDDLQLINGIGPTLERKLHRLGIYHFEQIAHLTAEDIELIDSKLKTYKGRVKRDKWPMQARRLHKELHASL